jgi:hypothetical protein
MMKRILACFLSVLMLAALLTACGSKSTATSAAASAAASAATSAATSAAASAATSAPSGDATLAFVFKNKTGLTMTGAYVYPAGSSDKGSNILSSNFENNTDKSMYRRMVMTRPAADKYTLYCEFSDGSNATFDNLDLMHKNSVSVKGLDEISPKTDTEVSFTDAEIAATLATGVVEEASTGAAAPAASAAAAAAPAAATGTTATLNFTFKNKTGKDLKEAYIYPTGSSDKGSNVLKAVWKNNESDADYLQLSLTVPDAETYDITVVATDGTTCTFAKNNLKKAASASMKDMVSEISVKDANDNKV